MKKYGGVEVIATHNFNTDTVHLQAPPALPPIPKG